MISPRSIRDFIKNDNIFKYTKGSEHMTIMDEYRQQLAATLAALKQAGESL